MVEIGTMQSRLQPNQWECETFVIHRSKLRLYQRRVTRPQDEQPYRDPADLPQFDASDRNHIQAAMTDCFSDVDAVRREHVEPWQGDQIPTAGVADAPDSQAGRNLRPLKPPDPLEELLPALPLTAGGNLRKRSGGVKPLTPEKPHFAQGGETHSGGGFAPPCTPPVP